MRVIIQRVNEASVKVDGKIVGKIGHGMMILVGFTDGDDEEKIKYLVNKILNLRIFDDENGIMNLSIDKERDAILSISQFTLYADTKKGNRPSYANALGGDKAIKLYEKFNELLGREIKVETGVFGADMKVSLINDGPVTISMER